MRSEVRDGATCRGRGGRAEPSGALAPVDNGVVAELWFFAPKRIGVWGLMSLGGEGRRYEPQCFAGGCRGFRRAGGLVVRLTPTSREARASGWPPGHESPRKPLSSGDDAHD